MPPSRLRELHEFEAIPEGIEDVDATKAAEFGGGPGRQTGGVTAGYDGLEVLDDERRMGLLGRTKILFDSGMDLQRRQT